MNSSHAVTLNRIVLDSVEKSVFAKEKEKGYTEG